jgi:4-diphosphocytidyl-2-C-methyl-D-erythritol kinase
MSTRTYIAPAKINLGLEIVRKRPDGYHDLNTLFYRVLEPRDSIQVTSDGSSEIPAVFRLTCSDSSLPSDARNLMVKAAHAFSERAGCPLPALQVHLDKHIPTGAGLGGGSSDAATMLEILSDHCQNSLSTTELMECAAKIGADVPFFLSGSLAAVGQGIGDVLTPIDLELSATILIVKDPTIAVSTKEAYENLELRAAPIHDFAAVFESEIGLEEMRYELRNDFEPSVFGRYPALAAIKDAM